MKGGIGLDILDKFAFLVAALDGRMRYMVRCGDSAHTMIECLLHISIN